MSINVRTQLAGAIALAFTIGLMAPAQASDTVITLIQFQDIHGNLVAHAGEIKTEDGYRYVTQGGGLAKNKTLIDEIRADNPNNLLLGVGDMVHGTAEVMFTVGDAIMPIINSFDLDAYTPGNWEFGYGPSVFRNRFTSFGPKPGIAPNLAVMANYVDCTGLSDCVENPPPGVPSAGHVIKANFPSLAINLYNDTDTAPLPPFLHNQRVLDPYKIFTVDGVDIAVIGITAAIVPQQAQVFSIGLRFTQGLAELPGIIEEVKDAGADVIVVQSELGLSQNLAIGQKFDDIDVILSAHTHETTLSALVASKKKVKKKSPGVAHKLKKKHTIVVETAEDMHLGRLDLIIKGGKVKEFIWEAIPVDDDVAEDPATKALVDQMEAPFVGATTIRHTFMPGGFCTPPAAPGNCGDTTMRGHQLTESLETVVGHTDITLHRNGVLEDEINNFIADAIFSVSDSIVPTGVDLSMTNGFRFGNPILAPDDVPADRDFNDGRSPGDITLRDLYMLFPISPALAVADFSGKVIENDLERVLSAVYNRNPFLQRGGWYMGLGNMTQKIDLDNRPFSSSGGRIIETMIGGVKLDPSKRYTFASCFPHGDPVDRVCRTNGGQNHQFFELADADDYAGGISLVPPVNSTNIISGPVVQQVAPDRFVHAVQMMRLHLDNLPLQTVSAASVATDRVTTVDSTVVGNPAVPAPVSAIDPTLIQMPEGAGPKFMGGISGIGEDDDD